MFLDHNSTVPIYMQIANWLETEILKGNFKVNEKIYSQYQLAEMLQINPATAAKGLTLLSQEGILYDRRGIGKFVSKEAKDIIKQKRKDGLLHELVENIVKEAMYLGIEEAEIIQQLKIAYKKRGGDAK